MKDEKSTQIVVGLKPGILELGNYVDHLKPQIRVQLTGFLSQNVPRAAITSFLTSCFTEMSSSLFNVRINDNNTHCNAGLRMSGPAKILDLEALGSCLSTLFFYWIPTAGLDVWWVAEAATISTHHEACHFCLLYTGYWV